MSLQPFRPIQPIGETDETIEPLPVTTIRQFQDLNPPTHRVYSVRVTLMQYGVSQICIVRQNYGTRIARIGRIVTDLDFLSVLIRMIRLSRVPFLVVASLRSAIRNTTIDELFSCSCLTRTSRNQKGFNAKDATGARGANDFQRYLYVCVISVMCAPALKFLAQCTRI